MAEEMEVIQNHHTMERIAGIDVMVGSGVDFKPRFEEKNVKKSNKRYNKIRNQNSNKNLNTLSVVILLLSILISKSRNYPSKHGFHSTASAIRGHAQA